MWLRSISPSLADGPMPYVRVSAHRLPLAWRCAMKKSRSALQTLTRKTLEDENRHYTGCGGISPENRGLGFLPAYLDSATGSIHLSRFSNGRRAPIHLLEGLPEQLVLRRDASSKVIAAKSSVSTCFVRQGRFYTREQAAMAMMREARDGKSPSSSRLVKPASRRLGWAFFFS